MCTRPYTYISKYINIVDLWSETSKTKNMTTPPPLFEVEGVRIVVISFQNNAKMAVTSYRAMSKQSWTKLAYACLYLYKVLQYQYEAYGVRLRQKVTSFDNEIWRA